MTKEESIIRVDASFNTLAYIREQIIKGYSLEDIDNHCKVTMEACTKQLKLHNVVVPKGTLSNLDEAIKKAKPNMDKIKDVYKHIDSIR